MERFSEIYDTPPDPILDLTNTRFLVDCGLISISHWGVFDFGEFGALIYDGQIEWQHDGVTLDRVKCDEDRALQFIHAVAR